MQYVADLHLHSKYSRAVSQQMILPVMADFARQKGLDILTASDFTHPVWFKEISNQLEEAGEGLYKLKDQKLNLPTSLKLRGASKNTNKNLEIKKDVFFLLSTEIASIYKQGEKIRRMHNLVFAPNLDTAEKINTQLRKKGCNLNSDGRPIIGLTSENLLELILGIDEKCFLIPCHVWTPHFGLYGSASGFDSIEEAFGDYSKYIYGVETGLSSDPDMNWSVKELMDRSILSFSDAHSPSKMGREATVFVAKNGMSYDKFQITYDEIRLAIMQKSEKLKIGYTIEFYPEEGKYHYSGHRNCKIILGPEEIEKKGSRCPVCFKKLTEGVVVRVAQLTESELKNRVLIKQNENGLSWYTDTLKKQPPYVKLVPLVEIVAEALNSTVLSQKVKERYVRLCSELGSELEVLLKSDLESIEKIGGETIAHGIQKIRQGDIVINPGYDGVYGKVKIWQEKSREPRPQNSEQQMEIDF